MTSLFAPDKTIRPLRERQANAIEAIRQAVREGHKRIIVQAPCGFGKTLLSAHLITSSVQKGKRPIFTCPAITLVNQTLKSFEAEGIRDIGVIQAQHERTDWSAQVQIASVQTLIRRALPEADFVIIDEVHNNFAKLNDRLDGEEWKDKIVIGLSATPWSKGLGLRWTKLIIAATVQELIDEGFLSPFIVYAPGVPDLSKVKVSKGEYEDAGLSQVMSDKTIVADVVKTWQEKGENLPTFMFAVDCAHAKSLRDEFTAAGVSCGYIDAYSDDDERKITFARFRRGEDKIIASVGCLTTGVDEDVRVIIDAAPTKSEIKHVQKIGRGLRTAPGKQILTILDHAGNTLRLGMVTDIYHDRLDTRTKKDKGEAYAEDKEPAKPRQCPKCHMVIPASARACPACGEALGRVNTVETVDGTLVEFKAKKKVPMSEKQAFYSELLGMAQERGFADGWVAHKYRERFSTWPRGLDRVPKPPSKVVRDFEYESRRKFMKEKSKNNSIIVGSGASTPDESHPL
jgi:superfamily II DNA or RNA helicase